MEHIFSEDDIKLAPPYAQTYNKLKAFFEGDPSYEISELNDETRSCEIKVENRLKYEVLRENLKLTYPENAKLGLTIKLTFTGRDGMSAQELAAIVADNPRFSYLFESTEGPFPYSSVVFKNGVVQYHNDNLFDPYSHATTLMETLAKELFTTHCFTSTDTGEDEILDTF